MNHYIGCTPCDCFICKNIERLELSYCQVVNCPEEPFGGKEVVGIYPKFILIPDHHLINHVNVIFYL